MKIGCRCFSALVCSGFPARQGIASSRAPGDRHDKHCPWSENVTGFSAEECWILDSPDAARPRSDPCYVPIDWDAQDVPSSLGQLHAPCTESIGTATRVLLCLQRCLCMGKAEGLFSGHLLAQGLRKYLVAVKRQEKPWLSYRTRRQTIQHKPLWAEPLVTCVQVTSRLCPDSAHIHCIQLTQAELAKFYSPGQIRPVRGLAPKPAHAFQQRRETRAESGPAPRDLPASPQKGASLPRVNVILRYLCIAVANLSVWEQPAEQERAH